MYEREWAKFGQENFTLHYFPIDWDQTLRIDNNYINESLKNCRFNSLPNLYALYKNLSKNKLKYRDKP